jgi:hypothetical protein
MLESSSLLEKSDRLVVLKVLLGDFIQSEECEKSFINTSNIPELGLQLTSNIHFSEKLFGTSCVLHFSLTLM